MEAYGFARLNAAGEYSPVPSYTYLTADATTTSTTYVQLLSTTITTESADESICCFFSGNSSCASGGHTARFQLTIDGSQIATACQTASNAGGFAGTGLIGAVTGLSPGAHTVAVNWRSPPGASISILPVTSPTLYHATLLAWRNQPQSRREMGGYSKGIPGWAADYTKGAVSVQLSSAKTSTATTLTSPLFTGNYFATTAPQSAILIRFYASGTNVTANTAKFQVFVDGVAIMGCAGNGDGATFKFNAGMIACAPVRAGNHLVEVYWAGGSSSGSSITPSTDGEGAFLTMEEVLISNFDGRTTPIQPAVGSDLDTYYDNKVSDMGGFPVSAYNALNVPTVSYTCLDADIAAIGSTLIGGQIYVTGEQSLLLVEAHASVSYVSSSTLLFSIAIDGKAYAHTQQGRITTAGTTTMFCSFAIPVAPGIHTVRLDLAGGGAIKPVTSPESQSAAIVVRELQNVSN